MSTHTLSRPQVTRPLPIRSERPRSRPRPITPPAHQPANPKQPTYRIRALDHFLSFSSDYGRVREEHYYNAKRQPESPVHVAAELQRTLTHPSATGVTRLHQQGPAVQELLNRTTAAAQHAIDEGFPDYVRERRSQGDARAARIYDRLFARPSDSDRRARDYVRDLTSPQQRPEYLAAHTAALRSPSLRRPTTIMQREIARNRGTATHRACEAAIVRFEEAVDDILDAMRES